MLTLVLLILLMVLFTVDCTNRFNERPTGKDAAIMVVNGFILVCLTVKEFSDIQILLG